MAGSASCGPCISRGRESVGREGRKRLVAAGYDRMAAEYLRSKGPLSGEIEALLVALTMRLSVEATVLDLGCGAGVPVTRWLSERFVVTGVDLSTQQVALARENVPGASFIHSDMAALDFAPASFDAIVSTYAIIHLPREEHPALLAQIARWLRPGGGFLSNWPLNAWEGEEANWSDWGAPMWWSHHGRDANLALLRAAGFTIVTEQLIEGDEVWLWVLAQAGSV